MNRIQLSRGAGTLFLILCAAIVTAPSSLQAAAPCPDDPVDLEFRDRYDPADPARDRVRSDGRKTYLDLAEMDSCGGLGVVFFGPFHFELNALGGTRSANGNVVFEVDGGLLGMEPGQMMAVKTTKVQFNFVVDSRRYFLAYYKLKYPDSDNIDVTRVDQNTWVIETPPGAKAKVLSQKAKGNGQSLPIDHGLEEAPFQITLVRKP